MTTMTVAGFELSQTVLDELCRRYRITRLAVFGSALRSDFRPDSDIDLLVWFEPGQSVGLFKLAAIEADLADLFGRKVDLNTPDSLSRYYRDEVLGEAESIYDAA